MSSQSVSPTKRGRSTLDAALAKIRFIYYQYEVTFGLFVMTPGEKFVLNSVVILFFSLVRLGIFTILPHFVTLAAAQLFWMCVGGTKEQTAEQVLWLNSTIASWAAMGPGAVH